MISLKLHAGIAVVTQNILVRFLSVSRLAQAEKKNDTGVDKSTVLFRWMKWLKPVAPFRINRLSSTGHLDKSVNLTWAVPLSGAGLDQDQNQLISTYIVNYTSAPRWRKERSNCMDPS